jgi:hypothetical protein
MFQRIVPLNGFLTTLLISIKIFPKGVFASVINKVQYLEKHRAAIEIIYILI